jgi:hypothetical protein
VQRPISFYGEFRIWQLYGRSDYDNQTAKPRLDVTLLQVLRPQIVALKPLVKKQQGQVPKAAHTLECSRRNRGLLVQKPGVSAGARTWNFTGIGYLLTAISLRASPGEFLTKLPIFDKSLISSIL